MLATLTKRTNSASSKFHFALSGWLKRTTTHQSQRHVYLCSCKEKSRSRQEFKNGNCSHAGVNRCVTFHNDIHCQVMYKYNQVRQT